MTKVVACIFRAFLQKFSLSSECRVSRGFAIIKSISYLLTKWQRVGRKGGSMFGSDIPGSQHRESCVVTSEFFMLIAIVALPDEAGDDEALVDVEPTTTRMKDLHR